MSPAPARARGAALLALLVVAVVVAAALVAVLRLRAADERHALALRRRADVQASLARLAELQATVSASPERRPDADLVTRVQQTLLAAGLPIAAFSGVQPQGDQAAGAGVRVQAVLLRLVQLRPAELGAWASAWQQAGGSWRIAELQLSHTPAAAPGAADDNRYDAAILLAAPYAAETP